MEQGRRVTDSLPLIEFCWVFFKHPYKYMDRLRQLRTSHDWV